MANLHVLDQFSLLQLFLLMLTAMLVFIETGFRLGKRSQGKIAEVLELADESEQMQQDLWRIAAANETLGLSSQDGKAPGQKPFTQLVSELIDIHAKRVQAALMNRIPNIIWISLYLCAFVSMLVMGYQAGLVGRRSPIATISVALVFTGIMMLITDLDRPMMSLFHMDNHIMIEVLQIMDAEQAMLMGNTPGN